MDSDLLLILRMRQGDEEALESFVRKYYPVILRYCRVHIPDPGYAEDMTQETFARFFPTLPRYRHYGKAANYRNETVTPSSCCSCPPRPTERTSAKRSDNRGSNCRRSKAHRQIGV